MRSIFSHKKVYLVLALSAVVGLAGCCCHHKKHCCAGDETAASEMPKDLVPPLSVDAKQVEVKPVESRPQVKPIEPRVGVKEVQPVARIIRIKAGSPANWKDKAGNEWLADAGFSEGAMLDYGKVKIAGTDNPELYSSEHTNMEKFSWPLANGKYLLKLHFAENLDEVKKPGDRVFSIDAMGQKINNLDVFKEAGGFNKALVKELHVNVTGGKLEINFIKSDQKEPMIDGIEIIPE
ncbi:MAG TPA: malectin domain-containing carbohydrate-binding protein [Planctomycetota bacterium]|nr:malectin domain-containing carbohydrate-binding protein [Planctomycetota bacterium]